MLARGDRLVPVVPPIFKHAGPVRGHPPDADRIAVRIVAITALLDPRGVLGGSEPPPRLPIEPGIFLALTTIVADELVAVIFGEGFVALPTLCVSLYLAERWAHPSTVMSGRRGCCESSPGSDGYDCGYDGGGFFNEHLDPFKVS